MRDLRETWTRAEVVSIISVVLSLLAVVVAFRENATNRENVGAAVYERAYESILELDRAHLNNPELRPYFYRSQPLEQQSEERDRADALAEMTLDCLELIVEGVDKYPEYWPNRDGARTYIVDSFRRSVVLREYFDSNSSWYSKRLRTLRAEAHSAPANKPR